MIIEPEALLAQLAHPQQRIIDIRGTVGHQDLGDGYEKGIYSGNYDDYLSGHIPGALFVDWTTDIVDATQPVKAQIASPEQFAQKMSWLGIDSTSQVVIYDQGNAQFATRLWWALKYYGHDHVSVLNGGWTRWATLGYPVSTAMPSYAPRQFISTLRPEWRIEPEQVTELLTHPQTRIIDARPATHYQGERSRGYRKGHIPGAINLPRPDLLAAESFKSLSAWRQQFQELGIQPADTVIAYCNGGVAASTILFALDSLGYPNLRLYDGSWNEWGNRDDLPLEQ